MNRKLTILIALLVIANAAVCWLLPRHRYDAIVIHHSASTSDNYASIKIYHKKAHGWRDAAYHLILSNGRASVPTGHLEATERYRNLSYSTASKNWRCNLFAIHLCVVGNYQRQPFPLSLKAPLANALRELMDKFGITEERILFHGGDCGKTRCPGRFLDKREIIGWVKDPRLKCADDIRQQHYAAIAEAGFSMYTYPRVVLVVQAVMSAICIGVFLMMARRRKKDADSKCPEGPQAG